MAHTDAMPANSSSRLEGTTLPTFELGIDRHDVDSRPRTEAWGSVRTHRFQASDGTEYCSKVYVPDSSRRRSDLLPITFTTPWLTDVAGFNDHIGSLLAEKGAQVVLVSPERTRLMKAVRRLGGASLAHDAKVHHLILDKLEDHTDVGLDRVANIGYSRGAMVGFGLQAYAADHDRKQPYNDYTDPCLEHGISLKEIPWMQLYPYAARELGAVVMAVLPQHGRALRDLAPTLVRHPGFWVSQASTGQALFRGEAGSFIDHLPQDNKSHVTLFDGSIFNHASDWEQRLAAYPNVTVEKKRGVHLTGANMNVIKCTIGRVLVAATP